MPGLRGLAAMPLAAALRFILQSEPFMPFGDGLLWISIKSFIPLFRVDFDPRSLELEHQVGVLRRDRKRRVYGGRERVNKVGPFGAEKPERRAAHPAKVPFGRARVSLFVFRVLDTCAIDPQVLAAFDLQCPRIPTEIDRVSTTALGLSADAAVTELIRVNMG